MNIFEFGDAKLRANDLDPLYTALYNAGLSKSVRQRFTLAEVTFDHAGVAARIASAPDFWAAMGEAADATLRGAPRRYFRGRLAEHGVETLKLKYGTGEAAIAALTGTFQQVSDIICKTWPGFGPCAAFKLADMAERVCGNKIDYSGVTIPQICSNAQVAKGALKAAGNLSVMVDQLVEYMHSHKWATLASPRYDRPLNVQEFETLLCYYSHDDNRNQHMPGMDSPGIERELTGYGKLADKLIWHLPHNAAIRKVLS